MKASGPDVKTRVYQPLGCSMDFSPAFLSSSFSVFIVFHLVFSFSFLLPEGVCMVLAFSSAFKGAEMVSGI